jgi:zona occludens toxin
MVLTTPNISKIRGDIRGCSEGAYKHKNQALLGIGGRYLEAFHLAEDNGKSNSDFLSVRGRKIKSYVWKLYASTATGEHSDTLAGSPLWKNPRVLLFVVFLVGAVGFLSSRKAPAIMGGAVPAADTKAAMVGSPLPPGPVDSVIVGNVVTRQAAVVPRVVEHPFSKYDWRLIGVTKIVNKTRIFFNVSTEKEELNLSSDDLKHYGYTIQYHTNCHADVSYKGASPVPVYCHKKKAKVSAFDPKNPLPL